MILRISFVIIPSLVAGWIKDDRLKIRAFVFSHLY